MAQIGAAIVSFERLPMSVAALIRTCRGTSPWRDCPTRSCHLGRLIHINCWWCD